MTSWVWAIVAQDWEASRHGGLKAPAEFLSMGHSSSLVFSQLLEADGFLFFQCCCPAPNVCLPGAPSRQSLPGDFGSVEVLGYVNILE